MLLLRMPHFYGKIYMVIKAVETTYHRAQDNGRTFPRILHEFPASYSSNRKHICSIYCIVTYIVFEVKQL